MAMSTKNIPDATADVLMATADQLNHIFHDLWKPRIIERELTRDEAQRLITNGWHYVPVMNQAADLLVDRVRSDSANTAVHAFTCNRTCTPQEAIDATGRTQYVDEKSVASMPMEGLEKGEMTFFKLGRNVSDMDLAKEYEARGLKPDPYAQAAVNEADPAFADDHFNGTHWKRADGGYNFLTFYRWSDQRVVGCDRRGDEWLDDWWFGGVRK
jgi:hypothetical protein